jgi:hypothetical protein
MVYSFLLDGYQRRTMISLLIGGSGISNDTGRGAVTLPGLNRNDRVGTPQCQIVKNPTDAKKKTINTPE